MSKYYIGLIPDESLSNRCNDYKNQAQELFGCHQAKRSPAHITIVAPFDTDRQQLALIKNLLTKITPTYSIFNLELNTWNHFKQRTIYLGVTATPQLTELFKQCNEYLSQLSCNWRHNNFVPHLTIINRDLGSNFAAAWHYFKDLPLPPSASFAQLVIFELGEQRWQPLLSYPLGCPQ